MGDSTIHPFVKGVQLQRTSTEKEERLTVPVDKGTMLVVGEGVAPWKVLSFLAP